MHTFSFPVTTARHKLTTQYYRSMPCRILLQYSTIVACYTPSNGKYNLVYNFRVISYASTHFKSVLCSDLSTSSCTSGLSMIIFHENLAATPSTPSLALLCFALHELFGPAQPTSLPFFPSAIYIIESVYCCGLLV